MSQIDGCRQGEEVLGCRQNILQEPFNHTSGMRRSADIGTQSGGAVNSMKSFYLINQES